MPSDLQKWLQWHWLSHLDAVLSEAGLDPGVLGDPLEVNLCGLSIHRARRASGLSAAFLRLVVGILLVALWGAAAAAPQPVTLPQAVATPLLLAPHVEVFEDLSGAMTYEQVSAPTGPARFVHQTPTREHRSSGFWYRFRLHNPNPQAVEWWLDTGSRTLSRADLFIKSELRGATQVSAGSHLRYAERPISALTLTLPVLLSPGETAEVYLRVQSLSFMPVAVDLKLRSPDEMRRSMILERVTWAAFVGTGLGLLVVNLLVSVQLRDWSYLLYALSLLSGVWVVSSGAGGYGAAFELLWPESPRFEEFAWLLSPLALSTFTPAFLLWTTQESWRARADVSLVALVWLVYAAQTCAEVICTTIGVAPDVLKVLWRTGEANFALLQLTVVGVVLLRAVRGVRAARLIVLGTLLPIVVAGYSVVLFIEGKGLPYHLTLPALMLEWFVMAYALADRLRQTNQEKAKAQADLVSGLQQSERELERKVVERTQELSSEKERSQALLNNILPLSIAQELQATGSTRPQRHEQATVLFTDFSGFTQAAAAMPADRMVAELNAVFAAFDDLCDEEGVEKIKTIGDAYMAVAGVPTEVDDHAQRCVRLALKMVAYVEARNAQSSFKWALRVGLHSGPVVSGVVGKRKYAFDVWGDTVNIAARMEAASEPGRVNVSAFTWDLVRGEFEGEYRGKLQAKGKGEVDMYFVTRGATLETDAEGAIA